MKTLHSCFPRYFTRPPVKGVFGIEIETEVMSYSDYPSGLIECDEDDNGNNVWNVPQSQYWRGVYDGSLRNYGVEYILKEPLDYVDTMLALDEFDRLFGDVPFLKDQPGTSVHVHLNFQNEPLVAIPCFVSLFTLFENLLLEFSGVTRRSNLFARSHRVADLQARLTGSLFDRMVQGNERALEMNVAQGKYAALNLCALQKLGTLEVRSFRGTTSGADIQQWIEILYDLYSYSLSLSSPYEFFLRYKQKGEGIIDEVFKNTSHLLKSEFWQGLVWRNEFHFVEYALHLDDWTELDAKYSGRPNTRTPKSKYFKEMEHLIQMADQPASLGLNQFTQFTGLVSSPQPFAVLDDLETDTSAGSDLPY